MCGNVQYIRFTADKYWTYWCMACLPTLSSTEFINFYTWSCFLPHTVHSAWLWICNWWLEKIHGCKNPFCVECYVRLNSLHVDIASSLFAEQSFQLVFVYLWNRVEYFIALHQACRSSSYLSSPWSLVIVRRQWICLITITWMHAFSVFVVLHVSVSTHLSQSGLCRT